jgi:hypothetical protein
LSRPRTLLTKWVPDVRICDEDDEDPFKKKVKPNFRIPPR